jgi:5-formyltetrahydrofolate cyclo-ligase
LDGISNIVPQNPNNAINRSALRKLSLAQRLCLSTADRAPREQALVQRLSEHIQQNCASATIALYTPHAAEPNLLGLAHMIDNCLCLPVVFEAGLPLKFATWQAGDSLVTERYGIATPLNKAWVQPDVLIVPCLAYNDQQFRLGYGGGYYDRTLAAMRENGRSVKALGVAWRHSLCDFQANSHDIAMDSMVLV